MKKNILIVEDDQMIRETLEDVLAGEGFSVSCAENGQLALNYLRQASSDVLPSLILLDLTMPVMNGTEFLDIQKHSAQLKSIPVAVFTAAGGVEKPPLADEFIRKPVQLDRLIEVLEKYCGN